MPIRHNRRSGTGDSSQPAEPPGRSRTICATVIVAGDPAVVIRHHRHGRQNARSHGPANLTAPFTSADGVTHVRR